MHWLFAPGFFASQPVHIALIVGGAVAIVSAIVGVFCVLRGQAFAGHALTDVSAAGGSAAFLLGVSPLLGFIGLSLIGAGTIERIGTDRVKGRDLATGIVLGAATGLAALLLYYDALDSSTTGAAQTVLFGSIFTVDSSIVPVVAGIGLLAVGLIAVLYRPLLLICASPELAAARGVRVRLVGAAFMAALAVAVGLSSIATGAILSTGLLIGPPATALRLTQRSGRAIALAAGIGLVITWLGILLAYDSYDWGSSHIGYPVSAFIVALALLAYLLAGLPAVRRRADRRVSDSSGG